MPIETKICELDNIIPVKFLTGAQKEFMDEFTSLLEQQITRHSFKKRRVILYQGEVPRALHTLLKGVVKTYSLSSSGEERVIRVLPSGEIFSLPWLFGKSSHSLYYYEALTDCTVACVDKQVFLDLLQEHPELQMKLLNYFATLYAGSMVHITALEQARAREKVLNVLYYLSLTSGREFKPGKFKVELNLTHSLIASLSGLTRETTALELSKLKKKGVIKYTARYYLIDKIKIEQLLGEESFDIVKVGTL